MKTPTFEETFALRRAEAQQALAALRATDPQESCIGYDLDAAMAGFPPASKQRLSDRGQAGIRLRAYLVADISDALLREFARDTLGALRCSEQYLDALRVVLGNQADAERHGYVLEMNQRVSFAPANVMRTIISQMQAAGVSYGSVVSLGNGRSQVVQCFGRRRPDCTEEAAAEELGWLYRKQEAEDDIRRDAAMAQGYRHTDCDFYSFIREEDVPY